MRRSRHSRTSGRQQALGDLFAPEGLEGEPASQAADAGFPLRPFAAELPRGAGVDPHAEAAEAPADRLLRVAREAARSGRDGDAVVAFAQLLEMDPGHLAGRVECAQLHESRGELDEAGVHLSAAVERHPDLPAALLARGAFLARRKQHRDAEADLGRAVHLAPDSVETHFALGFALWRRGVAADAVEHLRRAASIDPTRADVAHYLGEALHQVGDDVGALTALERATQLDTRNPKPFHLMGRVLDRLGRPEEAREMYRRAREVSPR